MSVNVKKGVKGFLVTTIDDFDFESTRDLLERIDYKLKDFANDLNMPYGGVLHILKGRRKPTLEIIQSMAKLLHVGVDDLIKNKA